jgi:hypothetical protein
MDDECEFCGSDTMVTELKTCLECRQEHRYSKADLDQAVVRAVEEEREAHRDVVRLAGQLVDAVKGERSEPAELVALYVDSALGMLRARAGKVKP